MSVKSLCFATNNANKLQELRQLLGNNFDLKSLQDIGCYEELAETQETLEGNSAQKANYVWENYQISCFADDTGLEVAALNNDPGVYSARYAGSQRNDQDNIELLLKNLEGKTDRLAQFRTIITLILDGKEHQFEGVAKGHILSGLRGSEGFGYDPVFVPEGYERTFAEMSMEEKNTLSHRGKAVQKLVAFLKGI